MASLRPTDKMQTDQKATGYQLYWQCLKLTKNIHFITIYKLNSIQIYFIQFVLIWLKYFQFDLI